MKGTRVVLTGGGGFIGSRLLGALVASGADVTLVGANLGKSAATARMVSDGAVRFAFYGSDPRRDSQVRDAMRSAELLVLLGYTLPTSRDPEQRRLEELSLNVSPNVQLLELAGDALEHVLFASSVDVYGSPERSPVYESDAVQPQSPYAWGKLSCEGALGSIAARRELGLTILRYATVYGPGETVPRAIPNFIRAALADAPLFIDGDGMDQHDYVYVDDVVDASCAALRLRAAGTYNIGTGSGTTTLEIARLVLGIANKDLEVIHRPPRSPEPGRTVIVCATERARAALDFSARWRVSEGLRRETAWFRDELLPLAREATTA